MSSLQVDSISSMGGGHVDGAGKVVQVVQYYNASAGHESTTSQSDVASSITKTITPKFGNSLILIQSNVTMADAQSGILQAKMYVNGSAMAGASYYHFGYVDSDSRYAPLSFQANYNCTDTSALTFTVYYKSMSGAEVRITYNGSSSALTLWEIAQ